MRHLNHFKTKYTEYKQKLRKANQNISTLMARIAKFDIQMQAENHDEEIHLDPYGEDQNWRQLLAQAGIESQVNLQD